MNPSLDLRLYLVTDRALCLGRSLSEVVDEAVQGGVTIVQLREKNSDWNEVAQLARALVTVLRQRVPLVINDSIEVANAVGAAGVHVGQSDASWQVARQALGENAIIGVSVEQLGHADALKGARIDYIGVSPVFSTATKADHAPPFGLEGLSALKMRTEHRCVGIGGINLRNARSVIRAGADGIAVVSAICSADSPKQAAMDLLREVQSA